MAEEKKWTIMAYMAADDILSDFAVGSLQQLRRLASQEANVVVVAQFDANGKRDIARLIFEGPEDRHRSIHASEKDAIASDTDMAEPRSLTEFINWAYAQRPADHYCLILWGHGPELLVADYPALPDGQKPKRFLTPLDIRKGLAGSELIKNEQNFAVVAVDACNMSMVELACEIADYAEFLVASEEEVPDFSFPYDRLLLLGGVHSQDEITQTCRELPSRYVEAYQDYILTRATLTESIALSSLALKKASAVIGPLRQLADALLAIRDRERWQAVISARANSQAFVFGLYVDLFDFCDRLMRELDSRGMDDSSLIPACQSICNAIQLRGNDAFVIANEVSKNQRCHGVSIYFPYSIEPAKKAPDAARERGGMHVGARNGSDVRERGGIEAMARGGTEFQSRGGVDMPQLPDVTALARGGPDLVSKGGPDLVSKGGPDLVSKLRRQRIEETEQYYPELKLAAETNWNKFIRHCWSRWLAEEAEEQTQRPEDTETSEILNQHYSAQQCAFNLLSLCRQLEKDATGECGAGGEPPSLKQEKEVPLRLNRVR